MSTGYKTSIKGKIFAIFLIGSAALVSSYFVNKFAFGEIRNSVEKLSHTSEKLIAINSVLLEVNESEKLFRNLITSDSSVQDFIQQSKKLKSSSDSLKSLCAANNYQVALIHSIDSLFLIREQLLLSYVGFRRELKNSNPLLDQAKILDSLFTIESVPVDSIISTNEHNKSTFQIDTIMLEEQEEEKKGLLRRIFKSRKKEAPAAVQKVVQTEENNRVDTFVHIRRNTVTQEAQRIIDEITHEQRIRRKKFLSRDIALNRFESTFHNQISNLLSEIEKDITHQTAVTHDEAGESIGKSINRILIILACFFFLSLVFVALMLTDITKSNKYRQLLEEARKDAELQSLSWQHFLSNMSHEIRTPLQSIIGYSEQMVKEGQADSGAIEIIHNSSEHLLQIINEILDYNRISSGKFTFESVRFHMRQLISEIILMSKMLAEKKGLLFLTNEQELPENSFLEGDPMRLKQILLNLIGNAIKFTDKGTVTLNVTYIPYAHHKESYTFKVTDTGPGIPEEMQEAIFSRFEKISLSSQQQYQGSGLGLSIAKALIEGQDGSISLQSRAGQGACFTFTIPYVIAEVPGPLATTAALQAPLHPVGAPVYLIDDDKLILQLCSKILERHHIPYVCFPNADSFLEHPTDPKPSLFMIDIRMFGMNGFQLHDLIRKKFPANIPIIAVTAQALPEERNEILHYGFNGILLKPFREEELLAFVNQWAVKNTAVVSPASMALKEDDSYTGQETEEAQEILRSYFVETEQDIDSLQSALKNGNVEDAAMMLHRLAGRTAQIGNKALGQKIRKLEIFVRDNHTVEHPEMGSVIGALQHFLYQINPE